MSENSKNDELSLTFEEDELVIQPDKVPSYSLENHTNNSELTLGEIIIGKETLESPTQNTGKTSDTISSIDILGLDQSTVEIPHSYIEPQPLETPQINTSDFKVKRSSTIKKASTTTDTSGISKNNFVFIAVLVIGVILLIGINVMIFGANTESQNSINIRQTSLEPKKQIIPSANKISSSNFAKISTFQSGEISGKYNSMLDIDKNEIIFTLLLFTTKPKARTPEEIGRQVPAKTWIKEVLFDKRKFRIKSGESVDIETPVKFYLETEGTAHREISTGNIKLTREDKTVTVTFCARYADKNLLGTTTFSFLESLPS